MENQNEINENEIKFKSINNSLFSEYAKKIWSKYFKVSLNATRKNEKNRVMRVYKSQFI